MKALVHDPTGVFVAFFNNNVSADQMSAWVNDNTWTMDISRFLNEPLSCSAVLRGEGPEQLIVISGDEDFVELNIIDIIPVL